MKRIVNKFLNLAKADFRVTSPEDPGYNCVAWAFEDTSKWWEPHPEAHWPADAPDEVDVDSYIKLFERFGYQICNNPDLDDSFDKIAIYVDEDNCFSHIARQLSSGKWTSKLGDWEDIEHTLEGLMGHSPAYGQVVIVMKKKKAGRGGKNGISLPRVHNHKR